MDAETVRWLAGPGRAVLGGIDAGEDPLTGIPRLRRLYPDVAESLLTAAWTLATVRGRHADRLGPVVRTAVLTDELAQQASRATVAAHRAARIAHTGAEWVLDGTCGAGLDALALTARGLSVSAADIDPVAAECARVNLGRGPDRDACRGVEVADITTLNLPPCDVLYVDPARRAVAGPRRAPGRAPIERDPQRWSPPWRWVVQAATRLRVVAKCAPGIPAAALPRDAEVEWVAEGREVVEATVWFGAGALRRATVLGPDGQVLSIAAEPTAAAAGPRRVDRDPVPTHIAWLFEPNEAVRRAGLLDALADELGLLRVHPGSHWLMGEQSVASPWVTAWRVVEWVEASALRNRLRGSGPTTYKTADTPHSAEEISRRVGHRPVIGEPGCTIIVIGSSHRMALATRGE